MLRAVIFDLDETLIDWSKMSVTWADIIREPLVPVYEALVARGYLLPAPEVVAEAYRALSRATWESTGPPEWEAPSQPNILFQAMRELAAEISEHDFNEANDLFAWRPIPGIVPFDDTFHTLDAVRATGTRTGLLTNMTIPMRFREAELKQYGLLDYFDVRLSAADLGRMKPHPLPFRTMLDALNVEPDEVVMLGDSPVHDVAGAQAMGIRAVWIERPLSYDPVDGIHPDATVRTLAEFLDILDKWYPEWRDTNHGGKGAL